MIPGEYILAEGDITCNEARRTIKIIVVNTGDRPVQVGSHFHFFEVNRQMEFNREKALGMRLNIAAGTAVRFEPGEEKEVELVIFGGLKKLVGFNHLLDGESTSVINQHEAIKKAHALHFKNNNT